MKNYRKYKEVRQIESPEIHNADKEYSYDKGHILNQQEKNYYLT